MIRCTDTAKEKLISVLVEENSTTIRFGLQGGGCNGFTYYFAVDDIKEDDDVEFMLDDTRKIIIDPMSMMYLTDAEIDYKRDLMGETFVFNNPNASTKCGCGSSVSF